MKSQQAVLTALGCAGSLAAMLAVATPAVAATTADVDDSLPTLAQTESNPIMDALSCGCARCTIIEINNQA
ncbi:MAG: hypothetical protein AAFY33_01075 [Cyanobacteria bacterium J06643_4]